MVDFILHDGVTHTRIDDLGHVAAVCAKHVGRFMNPRQREYFRRKLENWKEDILRESRETLESLQEESQNHPDMADRASSESDRALELRTRDRQRKLIAKIDSAIRRIDEGEYGYCAVTGEPISLARLQARPIATMTLEAQERHERNEACPLHPRGEEVSFLARPLRGPDGPLGEQWALRAGAARSHLEPIASSADARISELEGRDKDDGWAGLVWRPVADHQVDFGLQREQSAEGAMNQCTAVAPIDTTAPCDLLVYPVVDGTSFTVRDLRTGVERVITGSFDSLGIR